MINKITLIIIPLIFTSCDSIKEPSISEKCFEKPNPGKCRAYFKKYYFDSKDNTCKSFVWGGCGGNIPFKTLNECKSSCKK